MADVIAGLSELIEQGEKFTYGNFASKSQSDYPNAYSADWLVWTHHVNGVTTKIGQSTIANSIARGLNMELLGNDQDDFEAAKGLIVSGLKAAKRIFGAPIPAADRTVSLGHNSLEQTKALEKIDELVAAVEKANDLPVSHEDKEQILAELSASRKLLEASKIRLATLAATLKPSLQWIMEKAAGTIVGKVASGVWDFFTALHWL